jgi:hypothetical protein
LKQEPIPIHMTIMKKVDVHTNKWQQRPFTVIGFNEESKGYQLLDITGALLKNEIPREKLKIISETLKPKEEDEYEVIKKIQNDRGETGNKEYLVEWKNGGTKWVHELDFQAYDIIREDWKKGAGKGRNKKPSSKRRPARRYRVQKKKKRNKKKKKSSKQLQPGVHQTRSKPAQKED